MFMRSASSENGNAPFQRSSHPDSWPATGAPLAPETAFGQPRNFQGNRFVYTVISQRARGLSLGINLNPDKYCNFGCLYCEVDRTQPGKGKHVDIEVMAAELQKLLVLVREGRLREVPAFVNLPSELLELKEVALSGEGEPTLCPNFVAVVERVTHIRAMSKLPFFKVVLITNTTGLGLAEATRGLRLLTSEDEVWVKLDAGTQSYMDQVNRPDITLRKVLANILLVARQRPVVIQSLFPLIGGVEPAPEEIDTYVHRLQELKAAGAQISLVQVYSAHRPPHMPNCGHLPLKTLSRIARHIRDATGLKAEVF